jgi:hypothetical protein
MEEDGIGRRENEGEVVRGSDVLCQKKISQISQ